MSLHPSLESTIPEETCRVARAAFPKGNSVGFGPTTVKRHRRKDLVAAGALLGLRIRGPRRNIAPSYSCA
jgi:hypothetical protein